MSKLCFGDIVVVENNLIGVVVKGWIKYYSDSPENDEYSYDVYVRMANCIKSYPESEVERYMVRHKYLNDEELEYQRQAKEEQ